MGVAFIATTRVRHMESRDNLILFGHSSLNQNSGRKTELLGGSKRTDYKLSLITKRQQIVIGDLWQISNHATY